MATDTAIIGRVGAEELAGLAAAATVLALIVAGTNFLAYGTTERVANARGAHDAARATSFARHAVVLGALIGLFACVLLLALAEPLVAVLGAGDEVTSHGTRYLKIASLGLPAVVVMVATQGVLRGHADYRRPFVVLMVSNLLNALIELPLVFWAGWSITGSALSTVIAQYVGALWLLKLALPHLNLGSKQRFERRIVTDLLRVGRDLGIRVFSMLAIFTASTVLAARSGDAVLAAHQIVNGTFLLLALCLDAVSIPAHTLLGESRGAGQRQYQRLIAQRVYFWSTAWLQTYRLATLVYVAVVGGYATYILRFYVVETPLEKQHALRYGAFGTSVLVFVVTIFLQFGWRFIAATAAIVATSFAYNVANPLPPLTPLPPPPAPRRAR